jgi:hypothetical protein
MYNKLIKDIRGENVMRLGVWISNKTDKPFYARKNFYVKGNVKKAYARVSGMGQFIFTLNGKRVGDHVLDPGWTNYDKIVQYVEFDVTDLLRNGENVAGIETGNGWYIRDFTGYVMKFPSFKPPIPNSYKPSQDSSPVRLFLKLSMMMEQKHISPRMKAGRLLPIR